MQKMLAGMKPSWEVRRPMIQIRTLLMAATTHPAHSLRPTITVERMVNTQEM